MDVMRDDMSPAPSTLDYASPPERTVPRRPWVPFAFLAAIYTGEAFVPRNSRWPWPMTEDYVLLCLMFAGAFIQSLLTSIPAWAVGLYGIAGLLGFWNGQFYHWNFHGESISSRACAWIAAFVFTSFVCRTLPLMRRGMPHNLHRAN